jgi:hypothetical protein
MNRTRINTALAAAVLTLLGGCSATESDGAAPPEEPTSSSASVTPAAAPPAVPDELQGNWTTRLTQADIRHDLKAHGFGRYADRYIETQEARMGHLFVLTIEGGSFGLAYFEANRVWHVGWKGTATAEDGVLTFVDDFSGITESYRWSVDDGHLALDFVSTDGDLLDGLPVEAYSRAHFSRPLTEVGCAPGDLTPGGGAENWDALADDIQQQLARCA